MRSRGRCSEPLCEEGFVEAGDSAGEHQGVAGEAEPVGFEGPGERSESHFRIPPPQGEQGQEAQAEDKDKGCHRQPVVYAGER